MMQPGEKGCQLNEVSKGKASHTLISGVPRNERQYQSLHLFLTHFPICWKVTFYKCVRRERGS